MHEVVYNSFIGLVAGGADGQWGSVDIEEVVIEWYVTCM